MANALVRELVDAVDEHLKARAAGNNRSLEAELREIVKAASTQVDMETERAEAETMCRSLAGRPRGDSGAILSEDRQR